MKFQYKNALIFAVLIVMGVFMVISGCKPKLPERKSGTPFPIYEDEDWNTVMYEYESPVLMEKLGLEYWGLADQRGIGFYRQLPCDRQAIDEALGLNITDRPTDPEIHNPVSYEIWHAPLQDKTILDLYAQTVAMEDDHDPFWMNRNASDCEKYLQLWKKIYERRAEVMAAAAEEYLTPAQKKKSGEIQIMFLASDYPVYEVEAFQSLGLSAEQMDKLKVFRQSIEPEVEAYLKEKIRLILLEEQMPFRDSKQAKVKTQKEFEALVGLKNYRVNHNQIDYRDLREKARAINLKMKQGVSEVLTESQRQRMEELIANPPEEIQKSIQEVHAYYSTKATDGENVLFGTL